MVVHVPPDLVPKVGAEEIVERLEELGVRPDLRRRDMDAAGNEHLTAHVVHNVLGIFLEALVDERQDPDR